MIRRFIARGFKSRKGTLIGYDDYDFNTITNQRIGSACAVKLSIYSSTASLALIITSSIVSPKVIQPGSAGTVTVKPPSGS